MNIKLALIIIITCFAILYPLQKFLDTNRPPQKQVENILYVASPKTVKQFAFGFDGALSDLYWLRSVQYYGRQLLTERNELDYSRKIDHTLLYPLLDITTTLDHEYGAAYLFGALFLPDHDFDLALKLINKGIANNPKSWRLYQSLGTIYWKRRDYEKASATFLKGGDLPNAPKWMKIISGVLLARGGSRATACQLYANLYQEATDDLTRGQMEMQIKRVYALDEVDFLNTLIDRYKQATSQCPESLSMLIPTIKQNQETGSCGQVIKITINEKQEIISAIGDPFYFNKETCKIQMPYQMYEP
ncbi:MAG: hypothetical protein WAQ98_14065 [Blastocatellia bacterium]